MATTPEDLSYTKDHEWVRVKENLATVGITDHAQQQLGDVVYVELPKIGDKFEASEPFGSVESVKAVSEVYMPLGGSVIERIEDLFDQIPEQLKLKETMGVGDPMSEPELLEYFRRLASENAIDYQSFL